MDQALNRLLGEFVTNPVAAGMAMRRLLESNREEFFISSLPLLRVAHEMSPASPPGQGFNYLLTLLFMNNLILEKLTDTSLFSFNEAVGLARQMLRIEPLLDIKMVRSLLDPRDLSSRAELEMKANSERGIRLLEIMAAVSDGARILPVMAQLLQHPDVRVRSKAALLVGRSNKNYKWVEQRMTEDDPRVRANALESLWNVDSEGIRNVFWAATADSDNRAAGNGLIGLYKLGEAASIPLMFQMMDHPQADFRVTAIWIMGETGDPRFLPVLARVMSDPESLIRSAVFRAIGKLKQSVAKFSAAGPLQIRVGQIETTSDGWVQINLGVSRHRGPDEQPQELAGLKPTQFVFYDDSVLVSDYEVSEKLQEQSLAIAFALPRTVETDGALHRNLEQAFTQTLHHKRKNDAWVTLRYVSERHQPSASKQNTSILKLEQANESPPEALAVPPDLRFSTEPEAILSAVAAPGSRMSAAPSLERAARILVASAAGTRGSRHVVLVHEPNGADPTFAECNEIVRAARTAKAHVHAIVAQHVPALTDLCAKTGGFVLEHPLAELPQAFEALYGNLVSHYQARWRSDHSGAALKIQVFSKDGAGESIVARVPKLELEPALA